MGFLGAVGGYLALTLTVIWPSFGSMIIGRRASPPNFVSDSLLSGPESRVTIMAYISKYEILDSSPGILISMVGLP